MRAVKRTKCSRWLAVLLSVCIMLPYLNGFVLAAQIDGSREGLCEHHTAHTAECGYLAAAEGRPCTHVHDGDCGFMEGAPCAHQHTEDCYVTDCVHVHDQSCYETAEPPADAGQQPEVTPPGDGGEAPPADTEETETPPSAEIEEEEPPLAEEAEERQPVSCAHQCTMDSGCVTLRCEHVHSEECGYAAPAACGHAHDENCGYAEAVEGHPCEYDCQLCGTKEVLSWTWADGDGALVYHEETAVWGLGLPGVDGENLLTAAMLAELLPGEAEVELPGGVRETAALAWDLSGIPEEGLTEGSFFVYASLPEEYRLGEGVRTPAVLLDLGGGETLALESNPKFLNDWAFVSVEGEKLPQDQIPEITAVIPALDGKSTDAIRQILTSLVLPRRISGWVPTDSIGRLDTMINKGMFEKDATRTDPFEEMTATGKISFSGNAVWGYVTIDDWSGFPVTFRENTPYTLTAVLNSHDGYKFYVNSNVPADHEDPNTKSTEYNQNILRLTVTIQNEDVDEHVVLPANPDGTQVNLFDYQVDTDGAIGNDLLPGTDYHWNGDHSQNINRSGEDSWNKGINQGHVLLFGDGNIHAGFWNKGAGAMSDYGKTHAGMMGIVETKLGEDGYPAINQENLGAQVDHYEGISDWELCGDHTAKTPIGTSTAGAAHHSDNPKNISDTVQKQWNEETSLAYLFAPENAQYKRSYENVKGLFQLDGMGYYYYDMRQNFAEYDKASNQFVLYDAPAAERTDNSYDNGTGEFAGERSVGNFLPFNTAEQVFDGVKDGKLYSSENVKTNNNYVTNGNYLNHHLGMTVSVDFRQPARGKVNAGSQGNVPMTFQFSGDDDVWIFIDDVLVLDLGGIHSEIYGTIDFSTGEVMIGQSWKTNGFPYKPDGTVDVGALTQNAIQNTTLKDQFEKAGVATDGDNAVKWAGNTFASDTDHTLRMFFLERGNYDSSLALRFNLQPQLHQQIKKVDQTGQPMQGVEFELYPAAVAAEGTTGAIECLYTDSKVDQNLRALSNRKFYVAQSGDDKLCTLTTKKDGTAEFLDDDGAPVNFADRGEQYYILRETKTSPGYRSLPVDVVLHYDVDTSMLSVANRWTTGAYACSVSNIFGAGKLTYGAFNEASGDIAPSKSEVGKAKQENGLVVAVPMLLQKTQAKWIALYGGNLHGFDSVAPEDQEAAEAWRAAVLEAALRQASAGEEYADWHLNWDGDNNRLIGVLNDLPGLASRYQINNQKDADMRMVYGIIEPAALAALGINQTDAAKRYQALGEYVKAHGVAETLNAIMGVTVTGTGSGRGFSFLNVDQFNRNFRSLIYIPNEQRELRVQKVDQDGTPLPGTGFGLFSDAGCTALVASGTTDENGLLIFSPRDDKTVGHAQMVWAAASAERRYYLKEIAAPSGAYKLNPTVIPIVVGIYSIYADAGTADDGVSVMAGVGTLTQTMRQYAMDNDVDITLRDIVATMQIQPSSSFKLDGWKDAVLAGTDVPRSMDLHYQMNTAANYGVDYGLHDVDITGDRDEQPGDTVVRPFFVTDEGFIRTRVQQNYPALVGSIPKYEAAKTDTNKDDLEDIDLTSLFSLLNVVVVTDTVVNLPANADGSLRISKKLAGSGLSGDDHKRNFTFTVTFADAQGDPLDGEFHYFWGKDKVGEIRSGGTITLHHDDTVIIQGLPAGTKFTVTEKQEGGWYVQPSNGVISGEIVSKQTAAADFVNSKDPSKDPCGDLSITKTVTGEGGDRNQEFTFTVTLSKGGKPLDGYYRYTGSKNGEIGDGGTVRLKDGERITIHNLPVGTEYTVTESDNEGYTVTSTGETELIVKDEVLMANFVNHKNSDVSPGADLSITKTVTGEGGDKEKEFTFTVDLYKDGETLVGKYSYTGSKTGEISHGGTIRLKHGQQITIHGLPVGTEYTVTESGNDGYTVTSTGAEGTIGENAASEAVFVNHKPGDKEEPPTNPENPPKDPENPPKDPENPPKDPENPPKDPENPPKDPEDPPKDPENPPNRPTELPDPNDPDSPNEITIWEDGVPKTYIKIWDPEKGEWVYIPENEVPLIPMTEDPLDPTLWKVMCLASLTGLCVVYPLKRKGSEENA